MVFLVCSSSLLIITWSLQTRGITVSPFCVCVFVGGYLFGLHLVFVCLLFRRRSEQSVPYDVKRHRLHSHHSETAVVNQAVLSPEEHRYSFPRSVQSPLFHAYHVPDLTGCVPLVRYTLFPESTEIALPMAKDKVVSLYVCALHLPSE